MTTAIQRHRNAEDDDVAILWTAINEDFLAIMGWDDQRQVLVFPQDHPLLGWTPCIVRGCHSNAGKVSHGLCQSCALRWRDTNEPMSEFVRKPKPIQRCTGVGPCAVPGCQLPWEGSKKRLCLGHAWQHRNRPGQTLEQFLARPDLTPYPRVGPCAVVSCTRDRPSSGPYCRAHEKRFATATRTDPHLDAARWNLVAPPVAENADVSLRGLHPRVVAEIIYGLQERTRAGSRTPYWNLRPLCDRARALQANSLEEVPTNTVSHNTAHVLAILRNQVWRLRADPESEWCKDVWNLIAFGRSGTLKFDSISQQWLREAAKHWARENLPRRQGKQIQTIVQARLAALGQLSASLRLQREDHGDDLAALSRQDITAFCNRMDYLLAAGAISANQRVKNPRMVRAVLTEMRRSGLHRPSKPLHGLPDEFTLTEADLPDRPEDMEAGKDLPAEVMRCVCAHLPGLEEIANREIRVAVELMIDTGRRTDEVAKLALDCLELDPDGKPVLIYDNHKANRHKRRLPISAATAAVIVEQHERVRGRFPNTPIAELKLLPGVIKNPDGHKSISAGWLQSRHREWVNSLPDIQVPTVVEEDGKAVTRMLPFDKAKIFPYAYRHTYAQRHADAGVPVDVLRDLMNHRQLTTTQRYYNVGQERRREAVERVTTMQFDRHGNRVWRQAKALLDSEHARRAVGEVAVPYGGCSEPSNVAAGGGDCPVRFRCVGCGHFSTDISYLPDLERYLGDLLRHRERLAATLDADAWAKNEAMPSDNEVTRVRRLIDRMRGDLTELTDEERAQIDDAVAVVRRGRIKITQLGIPRVRQPVPDLRPERTA